MTVLAFASCKTKIESYDQITTISTSPIYFAFALLKINIPKRV